MEQSQLEGQARQMMKEGLNCAETVAKCVLDICAPDHGCTAPRTATAFGGGMARSLKETCGAVSGGLLALGYLWGRDSAKEKWDRVEKPAVEFRRRFIDEFGTCNCAGLLHETNGRPDLEKCTDLVVKTSVMLLEIINECKRP